jgi:hypothetical protein
VAHKIVEGQDIKAADRKADVLAVLAVFCAAVAAAVYLVSGWIPGI